MHPVCLSVMFDFNPPFSLERQHFFSLVLAPSSILIESSHHHHALSHTAKRDDIRREKNLDFVCVFGINIELRTLPKVTSISTVKYTPLGKDSLDSLKIVLTWYFEKKR